MASTRPPASTIAFLGGTLWRALSLASCLLLPVEVAAQGTEITRGKVTMPDGKPVVDANVIVTGLTTQAVQSAQTNDKGIYTVLWTNAEGDYVVTVRKIGYAPVTVRLTRTGIASVLVADVVLNPMAVQLDTINALANRLLPANERPSIGGLEQSILAGQLFSLDPTDLLSLALSVPGVLSLGDTAYSVQGAGGNANTTTIDGMKFGGGNVPRDAVSTQKLVQNTADVSRGGFSGGNMSMSMAGGTDIFGATARANLSNSTLAWTDPEWPRPIPRIEGTSGTIGGPIVKKRLRYKLSFDINDNSSPIYTLLSPRENLLIQQGITLDTVNALASTLHNLGVPLTFAGIPLDQVNTRYNTSAVFDFTPTAKTSIRLTSVGNWNTGSRPGGGLTSYPSSSVQNTGNFQFVAIRATGYVHGFLDEFNSTLNYNHSESTPFATLPGASVRVGTVFDDGRTGLTNLSFGGGGGLFTISGYSYDNTNKFSWLTSNSKHKLEFGQEFEYDWNKTFQASSPYGSYSYQSLADLAANKPASFSRTLTTLDRTSKGANTALWLQDEFAPSKAVNFSGGVRLDMAHPGTTPDYNPIIDSLYGLKTNKVPFDIGMSPRLGFSWTSKARRGIGSAGGSSGPLGGIPASMLAQLPPELLMQLMRSGQTASGGPPGIGINGSIGAYRGTISTSTIASLVDRTGLPNTRRTLSCVGAATPIPDWGAIGSPEQCVDGSAPGSFSVNQPTVQVYDPSFRAPVRWSANLGLDGLRLHKWVIGMNGSFSYNVNQASGLDMNLNRSNGGFTLSGEESRPVFVTPASIVPGTGALAPGASRIHPEYAGVTRTVSDLKNYYEQLQTTITPPHPFWNSRLNMSLTYTLVHNRQEVRGFGGGGNGPIFIDFGGGGSFNFSGGGGAGTAGDPFVKEWIPGSSPTHQFNLQMSLQRLWWFNLRVQAIVQSGVPFTPLVSGDINGDGSSGNDRAFLYNPATTADTALGTQMRDLLAAAPTGARNCIMSQLGHVAGPNTCRTPWQARLDLNMNFNPPSSWGYGDRLRLNFTMINASSALVRAFGLQNTPLGQSSLSTQPQSTLLYVTGFDTLTNNFKYRVNQLFGEPTNFGSARHKTPPFQIQLGMQYQLGGPPTQPMARSMGLLPGDKAPPLTIDQVRSRLQALAKDPTRGIMAQKDSLNLTPEQATRLATIQADYKVRSDSVLKPLIDYILKKGKKLQDTELNPRMNKVQPVLSRMSLDMTKIAAQVLTPEQRKKLPASALGVAPVPGQGSVAAPPPAAGISPQGAQEVHVKVGGGGGL